MIKNYAIIDKRLHSDMLCLFTKAKNSVDRFGVFSFYGYLSE